MQYGHWSEAMKALPSEWSIYCVQEGHPIGIIHQTDDGKFAVACSQPVQKAVVSENEIGSTICAFGLPESGWTLYR